MPVSAWAVPPTDASAESSSLARETASGEHEDMPPLEGEAVVPQRGSSPTSPTVIARALGGGDVVLILDLPEVFTIGYDCVSFTARHFGGVKEIPPGPHLIWVSHPNGTSVRCGAWITSSTQHKVHVLQWDKYNEILTESSSAEARKQASSLANIHSKLVSYRDPAAINDQQQGARIQGAAHEDNEGIWNRLTSCISETLLNRITVQHRGDWFVSTVDKVRGVALIPAEIELENRISNSLQGRDLNFIFSQTAKTYSAAGVGSLRTQEATDASHHIVSTLADPEKALGEDDFIGEFQFAYIVGTHLGNDACLQQWWYMLLKLTLRSYSLIADRPTLVEALLRSSAAQINHSLKHLETSVFDYSERQSRDLRLALTIYKRRLQEDELGTPSVNLALSQIEAAVVQSPLGWDINKDSYIRQGTFMTEDGDIVAMETTDLEAEDERGEFAPEVVELDESGREKGLVSWTN
ncbi:uncharacterized protein J7T54_007849 [Emericellopsis cladophorae]|uniref:Uncharacterized protein n=1 Tax=Emericellopsis cladophorae TaxID=2686198 RepID=A0A9P9Y7A6_9HYPO|nr:uncharacterized protein J7T54_007849 [Emericellopsis cladophorae]KAI6784756.1 hypothetical protein J7T54_007849 [Emericellopsis cladophorae]